MEVEFKIDKNDKQKEATKLITSGAKHILLYGGSRSGKTTLFIFAIIVRSLKSKSRHVILRNHLKDVKTSVWNDTLRKLLSLLPKSCYKLNNQDYYVRFTNGSEIWLGGLDKKERVEKILGTEFATIFFNECSEISYHAYTTALTRLSQKADGLKNLAFYDCNPPTQLHWIYKLFFQKENYLDCSPIKNPKNYVHMRINPVDNLKNLSDDYMDILDAMPEKKRARFRDGVFTQPEGVIFDKFDYATMVIPETELPLFEHYTAGIDFGLNMAAIKVGWYKDKVYIIDEHEKYNITTNDFNSQLHAKGWHSPYHITNFCDPAGGERIFEITNGIKADNSVEPGIDFISTLIEQNRFYVVETAKGFLAQISSYRRSEKGIPIKENEHLIDAARYAIYTARDYSGGYLVSYRVLEKRERVF